METIDDTGKLNESLAGPVTLPSSKQIIKPDTKLQTPLSLSSRWANRFIIAAIAQGALAVGLTSYLLYQAVYPIGGSAGSARVVAGGSAGTWLTVGYLGYIMLGPLAAAVTALFYQHLEVSLRSPYTGWTRLFPWLHIILMNVGVVGATFLMMNGGYRGGDLTISLGAANPDWKMGQILFQVHEQILAPYPGWIAPFAAIGILGAIAGGIGYAIIWRRSLKKTPTSVE